MTKNVRKNVTRLTSILSVISFVFTPGTRTSWSASAAPTVAIEITEVMYDAPGSDTGQEWVELVNVGTEPITVVTGSGTGSWRFFDTSNHTFTLFSGRATLDGGETSILTSDPARFLANYPAYSGTIFKVALSLPNRTTTLKLSADKGTTWFHERTYQASLANGNGQTLEWTGGEFRESTTLGGTPGHSQQTPLTADHSLRPGLSHSLGVVPSPPTESPLVPEATGPIELVISEVAYNPIGSDSTTEWLTVTNRGSRAVTIVTGSGAGSWRLEVTSARHTLRDLSGPNQLGPGDTLVISRNRETFQTTHPDYAGPLAEASFSLPNTEATLRLSLDGGVTWLAERNYHARQGGDGDGRTLVETPDGRWQSSPAANDQSNNSNPEKLSGLRVLINEFLPFPPRGQEEWVEVLNPGSLAVNLAGWSLDDGVGGSKPYLIPADRLGGSSLEPLGRLVFPASETKISLANTTDLIRLLRPDQSVADQVPYQNPAQGRSWIRFDLGSRWTTVPTPHQPNRLANEIHPADLTAVETTSPPVVLTNPEPAIIDQDKPTSVTLNNLPQNDGWRIQLTAMVLRKTPSGFILGSDESLVRVILPETATDEQRARAHQSVTLTGTIHWEKGEATITVSDNDLSHLTVSAISPPAQHKRPSITQMVQAAVIPPASAQIMVLEPRPPPAVLSLSRQPLPFWTNYLPLGMMMSILSLVLSLLIRHDLPTFGISSKVLTK